MKKLMFTLAAAMIVVGQAQAAETIVGQIENVEISGTIPVDCSFAVLPDAAKKDALPLLLGGDTDVAKITAKCNNLAGFDISVKNDNGELRHEEDVDGSFAANFGYKVRLNDTDAADKLASVAEANSLKVVASADAQSAFSLLGSWGTQEEKTTQVRVSIDDPGSTPSAPGSERRPAGKYADTLHIKMAY